MNYFVALETDKPDQYVIARSDDSEFLKNPYADAWKHVSCVGFWVLPKDEALKRVSYMNGAFAEGIEFAKKKFLTQVKAGLAQW